MARPRSAGPTERELEILHILWRHGPSTVRDVHEELQPAHSVGYTSVLKLLQVMHEKGLVERDERRHAHRYSAAVERDSVEATLTRDLLDRVFRGSASGLILRALSVEGASDEELERADELLRSFGRGRDGGSHDG